MDTTLDLSLPGLDDIAQVQIDPNAAKWETLIDQIIEGNVIPVIGSDILMDGINIERYLIDLLAKNCGITSKPTNFSELLYDENLTIVMYDEMLYDENQIRQRIIEWC